MIKNNLEIIHDKLDYFKNKLKLNYDIKLIAVSKTHPVESVIEAIEYGQCDFGENRVIEAYEKFNSSIINNKKFNLHLLGHLQRNKVKEAVEIVSMVQSIDKIETLDAVEKACSEKNKIIDFLIEINTSFEAQKYGVHPDQFYFFLDEILKKKYKYCNLRGVMTVGPLTSDKIEITNSFKLLYKFYDKIKNELKKDDFNVISMGMSSDYEIAISEGSNMVRIGTAIFGSRV